MIYDKIIVIFKQLAIEVFYKIYLLSKLVLSGTHN